MPTNREKILDTIAGLKGTPEGAYNIRVNGKSIGKSDTKNVEIVFKENGSGMDIHVKSGTKGEKIHIPVVIDTSGYAEVVYNEFYIGEDCDIEIIAGCGIHNDAHHLSQHDGVHTFYIGKNSRVKYIEKHYGESEGGENALNPVTECFLAEGSYMEMDTVQIRGVDLTRRETNARIDAGAKLVVREKLMTDGSQRAVTVFNVELNGEGSGANVMSRSVARGSSYQEFLSVINGNNRCMGHSECDAIIMDSAIVRAIPEITANHPDASLIHEAAIGKIAGEQITKLMTLGLTSEEAEAQIVNGFLK